MGLLRRNDLQAVRAVHADPAHFGLEEIARNESWARLVGPTSPSFQSRKSALSVAVAYVEAIFVRPPSETTRTEWQLIVSLKEVVGDVTNHVDSK